MSEPASRLPGIRTGLSIGLAIAALIVTAFFTAPPQGETDVPGTVHFDAPTGAPWCGPADLPGAKSCRYSTFEHCLEAARADYRSCRPNPAALVAPDDASYWTYRSVFL